MAGDSTKDAPAFDFYPERWLAGTADLSDREYRQYMTLLCHAWLRDGLPKNERILKQICGKKVSPKVLEKFADFGDEKLRNPMLEKVRETQRTRIESSRERIRKMNEARLKGRLQEPLVEPLQEGPQEALQGPPHHSPLTTHPIESHSSSEPLGARATVSEAPGVGKPAPTLAEIQGYAARNMIAPEIAEAFFHAMEAVDWVDAKSRVIRKPEAALIGWARNWKEIQAKQTNGQARQPAAGRPGVNRNAQPGNLNDPSEYD